MYEVARFRFTDEETRYTWLHENEPLITDVSTFEDETGFLVACSWHTSAPPLEPNAVREY